VSALTDLSLNTMQVSTNSYELYHWHTSQEEVHDCIEDSTHVFK
jgi:hypothetical protein